MRIQMQDRDYDIINTIREYKVMDTNMIADLWFNGNNRNAIKRLNALYNIGKLNKYREKTDVNKPYIWYINRKPRNLNHALMLSKLMVILKLKYKDDIIKLKKEFELLIPNSNSKIRVDMLAVIRVGGTIKPFIYEIDLKPHKNNLDNYIKFKQYLNQFPFEPTIYSIGRYEPKSKVVKYIPIKNLDNSINLL